MKNPVFLSARSFIPSSPVGEIVFRLNRRSETTNAASRRQRVSPTDLPGISYSPEGTRGDRIRTCDLLVPNQALSPS